MARTEKSWWAAPVIALGVMLIASLLREHRLAASNRELAEYYQFLLVENGMQRALIESSLQKAAVAGTTVNTTDILAEAASLGGMPPVVDPQEADLAPGGYDRYIEAADAAAVRRYETFKK